MVNTGNRSTPQTCLCVVALKCAPNNLARIESSRHTTTSVLHCENILLVFALSTSLSDSFQWCIILASFIICFLFRATLDQKMPIKLRRYSSHTTAIYSRKGLYHNPAPEACASHPYYLIVIVDAFDAFVQLRLKTKFLISLAKLTGKNNCTSKSYVSQFSIPKTNFSDYTAR